MVKKKLKTLFDTTIENGDTFQEVQNNYQKNLDETVKVIDSLYNKEHLDISGDILKDFNSYADYEEYQYKNLVISVDNDNKVYFTDSKYITLNNNNEIQIELDLKQTAFLNNQSILKQFVEMVESLEYRTDHIDTVTILSAIQLLDSKSKSINEFTSNLIAFAQTELEYTLDIIIIEDEILENEQNNELEA